MSASKFGELRLDERDGRVRLTVHVQPRAASSEVVGVHGDALKVRLTAPPVDGAANDALVEFLADVFAVRPGAVRIVAGLSSRTKVVDVAGRTANEVRRLSEDAASA